VAGSVTLLTPVKACSAAELQAVATACATGFSSSPTCKNYLNSLVEVDCACSDCLENFTFDFDQPDGIVACASPFVGLACAQQAACWQDCIDSVCGGCGGSTLGACQMQSGPAACSPYAQGNTCLTAGLSGAASLCNPATYNNNFGAWLAAVGKQYCTMP
jgi:hypothetical protein